jgi:hypothetical protein
MHFDREKELLYVTDRDGKEAIYSKGATLPTTGGCDVYIVFEGSIIDFDEIQVRSLPERLIVRRRAESDQFGERKSGSSDERVEYLRSARCFDPTNM